MKLVIDVHYNNNEFAVASGVLFSDWESSSYTSKLSVKINDIEPYQPGSFFKRELPCILALLNEIKDDVEVIVIDGYVTLGEARQDGLGSHLYNNLNTKVPIIGVAKNRFAGTPEQCEVLRGTSKKPLYVTSIGISQSEAKKFIQQMHGEYRVPTLLKLVDSECRNEIT
ncbi:endonuclease V [Motilimonas cestriensis]|uniref:Endonuclease V n=1 Tax=Motilimonas cestriensis TaxID=2742685 RepID=A0ABS8W8C1_9GAMM|nr:endonuclease V [Motilimonas cestriensis]MCE2594357.1 endonuclease V [Motilimonas cestriensis]